MVASISTCPYNHKRLGKTLFNYFITCLTNSCTCMCVHACVAGRISVHRFFVCEGRRKVGDALTLSLILTSRNWNHLDTLPKPDPWVKERPGEVGLKQRKRKELCYLRKRRRGREEGRKTDRAEADKEAMEAEKKSRSKEVWNLTLCTESVVMGQGSSAEL